MEITLKDDRITLVAENIYDVISIGKIAGKIPNKQMTKGGLNKSLESDKAQVEIEFESFRIVEALVKYNPDTRKSSNAS